jgi:hypothetical protein
MPMQVLTLGLMNASKRKNRRQALKISWIFYLILIFITKAPCQNSRIFSRIMFYNVENLYDTRDDPNKNDEEFLPGGLRGWSGNRMNEKILRISKVILSAGNPEPPGIIGMCEIENRYVLERLINDTPLKSFGYKIVHKESPDSRGIDVVLIYRDKFFHPLTYEYLKVTDPHDTSWSTREILHFSCISKGGDTLHVFFNHWPSRSAGVLETSSKRALAAEVLSGKIKELQKKFRDPKIIVMGDFNDQPADESIRKVLGALSYNGIKEGNSLYDLSAGWSDLPAGTHKYQSQWSVFDQVIVSGAVLNNNSGIGCSPANAGIFHPQFLLQNDKSFGGVKPFRTFSGYKYIGGFSDHLPVYLDLLKM